MQKSFWTLFLFILAMPWASMAVDVPVESSDQSLVMVETNISNEFLNNLDLQDLGFVYDPEALREDAGILNSMSKQEMLQNIEAEIKQNYLNEVPRDQVQIPWGPRIDLDTIQSDEELALRFEGKKWSWLRIQMAHFKALWTDEALVKMMGQLQQIPEQDLRTFLSKKQQYLQRVQNIFKKLEAFQIRIPVRWQNIILIKLNNFFFGAPQNIIHSNTVGGQLTIYLSSGFSLGRILGHYLRDTKIAKYAHGNKGLYFYLGLGAGLAVSQIQSRSLVHLEAFVDFAKFKNATTPVLQLFSAGATGTVFVSSQNEKMFSHQKFVEDNIPFLGSLRESREMYGFSSGLATEFPPVGFMTKAESQHERFVFRIPIYSKKRILCRSSLEMDFR